MKILPADLRRGTEQRYFVDITEGVISSGPLRWSFYSSPYVRFVIRLVIE